MAFKRPKICLLFCGGSTLVGHDNALIEVTKKSDIEPWLAEASELAILADVQTVFVYGDDRKTVAVETWIALAKEIQKRYQAYNGFVITHNFDSIIYTGAALSFMLRNLGKPVVLTGAQETGSAGPAIADRYHALGIRANLINAIQVATLNIAEVGVMYGNVLLRATQAVRAAGAKGELTAWLGDNLGEVDFGIKLSEQRQRRQGSALLLRPAIEKDVFMMHVHPGFDLKTNLELLSPALKGVIIRATDVILQPEEYAVLEEFSVRRRSPVFLLADTEAPIPKKTKLIVLPPMLPEIALTKVMWALGQNHSRTELRQRMNENIAHEILIRSEKS